MAVSSGWTAALNAWRGDTAETRETRTARYTVLWGFYLNDIYNSLVNDMATAYKAQRELYTDIKGIYNPVARLVDFYVAKVAGGALDPTGEAGALPIVGASPETLRSIMQVWAWSRWGSNKALWVRYAASMGDCALKIVSVDKTQVQIEVHHPGDLAECDFDRNGDVVYAKWEYTAEERDERGAKVSFLYREIATPDMFYMFKNGKPFDYAGNQYGGPLSSYANPYGFVPAVVTRHKLTGQAWGMPCFHHVIDKVDDVNDLASHLGDQIRKAVHPQWVSFGTKAGSGMERSDKVWHHPNPTGKIQALVEDINIADCASEIQNRLREIEQDCPELKVYQVDQEMSGRALRLMFGDVVDRVTEARGQYDAALVRADEMALKIGAKMGLWGAVNLTHAIGDRPILPVDESEELLLETQRLSLEQQRAMMTGG